jgi:hypothetical protein
VDHPTCSSGSGVGQNHLWCPLPMTAKWCVGPRGIIRESRKSLLPEMEGPRVGHVGTRRHEPRGKSRAIRQLRREFRIDHRVPRMALRILHARRDGRAPARAMVVRTGGHATRRVHARRILRLITERYRRKLCFARPPEQRRWRSPQSWGTEVFGPSGAGGRDRTDTPLREQVFETCASTGSATPAAWASYSLTKDANQEGKTRVSMDERWSGLRLRPGAQRRGRPTGTSLAEARAGGSPERHRFGRATPRAMRMTNAVDPAAMGH